MIVSFVLVLALSVALLGTLGVLWWRALRSALVAGQTRRDGRRRAAAEVESPDRAHAANSIDEDALTAQRISFVG